MDQQHLPKPVMFKSKKDIRVPRYASEGLMWLIGYMHGDGYVKYNGVYWIVPNSKPEIIPIIQVDLYRYFNITPKQYIKKSSTHIAALSVPLRRWFDDCKYSNRCVMPKPCTVNKDHFIGYVSGLYAADGSENKGTYRIRGNPSLLEQIQAQAKLYEAPMQFWRCAKGNEIGTTFQL